MRYLLVVVGQPLFGLFADLAQRAEYVHIQYATPVAAVEAFDKTVLHRTPRLDEIQRDTLALSPLGQGQCNKFRAIVQTQLVR